MFVADGHKKGLCQLWKYGSVVGMFIVQIQFGLTVRSFGILFVAFQSKFSTTASLSAWCGAVNLICFGLTGPVAAVLCMRVGCRRVTIFGTILQATGYLLVAFADHIWMIFVGFGILLGVGVSLTTSAAYLIVPQHFSHQRALALSIASCGSSVGVFIFPPLIELLLEIYGFAGACLILSSLVLHGLISGFLFKEPEPSQGTNVTVTASQHEQIESDIGREKTCTRVAEVIQHWFRRRYQIIVNCPSVMGLLALNFGASLTDSSYGVFLVAHAKDQGIQIFRAAILLSMIGVADVAGRLIFGFVFGIKALLTLRVFIYGCIALTSCTCSILVPLNSAFTYLAVLSIVYGFFVGSIFAQRPTIAADLVGLKNMPIVFGLIVFLNATGHTLGRFLGGMIRDSLGGYDVLFFVCGSVSACTAILLMVLTAYNEICHFQKRTSGHAGDGEAKSETLK